MELDQLTDSELYTICKKYGNLARAWRAKFAGLLPEVVRRNLHKRRGYSSIHEFAGKIAGMSERSVDRVLSISRKLEGKPELKSKLESGAVGWTKLEKVAFIATSETDKFWADKVENLCTQALDVYVHETRELFTKGRNILSLTDTGQSKHELFISQAPSHITFPLTVDVETKLRVFKHKLEKEKRITLTYNAVFKELLNGEVCERCVKRLI